jgi:UDP-N-acetylmuramyl-tripeptide synthetase
MRPGKVRDRVANDTAKQLFTRLAAEGAMIAALAADSRRCAPGVAFFAYPGEAADGRAYIGEAVRRGAAAIVWEESGFAWRDEWRVPNAAVLGLRQQAGTLAAQFHGKPSEALWMCGVTGTNGKTSCTQWIAAALGRRGAKTGVIGTLGAGFPGSLAPLPNTTPDALEIQRLLREMREQGAEAVAMEVSSHGLAQARLNGVAFDCALFTNLSHDHLDYHRTMQAYGDAKAKLFGTEGLEVAVLNLDDAMGLRLAREAKARSLRVIGYGFAAAAATAVDEYLPASLLAAEHTRQVGRFNVANALGVLGCLLAFGLGSKAAMALIADLPPVPGRMERVADAPLVVVDYAHTPDALEKVLTALRPLAAQRGGRLIIVFGAGGDRDPSKRPLMGEVARRLADRVLATSDNPRGEDPLAIIRQIGVADSEVDRARAIEKVILEASANDVILVAGKGHEDYQEIAGKRLPFSDAAAVRAAVAMRGKR